MGIQLRYEMGIDESLKGFEFGGLVYEILRESRNRDLISANPFHIQKQYMAQASDGKQYEVYVYYYSKFENGKRFAVVDAIRLAEQGFLK
ncbi:hypothetical protein SDC9_139696 [bioreactor metagenome]|jgi:hypothetical protein|uniref:Uncharacterized protein n=1 Tax=bioreactor metagenome TaxID=1076179 RepID=A0A645DTB0_9ZZZZ